MGRTIVVEVPDPDYARLERAAVERGITVSEVARERLCEPADQRDGEEAVHKALVESGLVREGGPSGYSTEDWAAWQPVRVPGEPVSESVIRERR